MTCVIDISLLQFGQCRHYGTRQVGAHDTSFRPTECRGEQKAHPGLVPVSLKSKSWNWLGRFATAARSRLLCAYYPQQSSKKETGYDASRMPCCAAAAER